MAGEIPGSTLRMTLEAVQGISGPQYSYLLKEAGLSRYAVDLPPDDWRPAATQDELTRLYQTVYRMLGEALTRLFFRHQGQRLAQGMLTSPWGQALAIQAREQPADKRLAWFIQEWTAGSASNWIKMTVTEDATAWYLTPQWCPYCVGVHDASTPLCATTEALNRELIKAIAGWTVHIAEVECKGMGAAQCRFAIYKPSHAGVPLGRTPEAAEGRDAL